MLGSVLILVLQTAGAARTSPRALPSSLDFQQALLGLSGDKDSAVPGLAPGALLGLQAPHDDGEVLDIPVAPYIWEAASLVGEMSDSSKMKLSPSGRITLSSMLPLLPHFNKSCSCEKFKCSCCVGVEVIRRNLTVCASLSYVQERLAIVGQLSIKNRTIIDRELISGSNPPPLCFPIPQIPIIRICVRLNNITFTADAHFQACSAIEVGLVFTQPLIRLRFGCVKIGHEGISWSSTPSANSLNLHSVEDAQTAFQQFAAALNSTDSEQFQLLQSLLRQHEYMEKPSAVLPARNRKMAWPLA